MEVDHLHPRTSHSLSRPSRSGRAFTLHFGTMQVVDMEFDLVRRLSTPPSLLTTPPSPTATPPVLAIAPTSSSLVPSCHTVWKYYCRDNFGWREYSEVSAHKPPPEVVNHVIYIETARYIHYSSRFILCW